MEINKFYDYDWAVNNIFENDNLLFERRIDFIFFFMRGYDSATRSFGGRIPETCFFTKFWKWMIGNINDYEPTSMYWYIYFQQKSKNNNISEEQLFYKEFKRFIKSDKKPNTDICISDDSYLQFQDETIIIVFLVNRKPEMIIKKRKISYIYYVFLGEAIFLEKNFNISKDSNIVFKFGKWLNKKYPEYDENKIGLFLYLIIEDLSKKNNKDELNLLAELFTEFLQVSENRNVVFDEETKKLYEYNGDGSIKKEF